MLKAWVIVAAFLAALLLSTKGFSAHYQMDGGKVIQVVGCEAPIDAL